MNMRCNQADHQNQQIIGFCISSTCPNKRPYCNFCLPSHIEHLNKLTSLELSQEWIKERIIRVWNVQKIVQECKLTLDSLINFFLSSNKFNLQQIQDLEISQIDNLIKDLCYLEDCEENLYKQVNEQIQYITQIGNEIAKKIKNITNLQEKDNFQILQQNQEKQILVQQKHFNTFELMYQNSIKQEEQCCAIAFNTDNSIVIAGSKNNIKVFQHIKGRLNQISLLSEHKDTVLTLNFMNYSNNFVSGSNDQQIIIWQMVKQNKWKCQQKLNGHTNAIFCLLLNYSDDLIISGGLDNTIKFWMKQNRWVCYQNLTDHTHTVYSLSLNEEQNKLISCSYDQYILIIEYSKLNKQWSVTQKIKVNQFGQRLCFINDQQFAFQPFCKDYLQIYEMDRYTNQYKNIKQIAVKCGTCRDDNLFPQQYLKSKCLLVSKNGMYINLIRKKENGDFILEQSIQFGTQSSFGKLTDDGEYLITWESELKEMQIRKYQE
ncbi:unnamed protein product [Paramecium pentaurelia]|uniref:WD40-repeat-containing domain n=1 Tax=Paramecium pentaurelia TaxID=43138 RepID=A0A8S1X7H7_9CILI|nr:unnamed protein product [Paramecium pentaurelia]